ncbi:hypothetical protein SLEP1_g54725 [Rubroshorea leprosula]|uniref:Protein kinase domain-containing protein n=1 Tax=Rubroshorea leprosula TaxID=152421 RepID=A0AAV5MEH7_9ROSI|nr:hypothetical protein SLEP1_g54725 [Rubroshorea leprosula]
MEMLPQPIFSSTFVCIITIFSILLLLPPSYSDPLDEFIKCNRSASFECGSHGTFYYPFWNDNTPEHCHPLGFRLKDCEKGVPTIDFGPDGLFQLQRRNPSDYSKLTIASIDLKAYICPKTPQNKTLPFLKFSETDRILTLFYNCTPPQEVLPGYKIDDCGPNDNSRPFFMPDWEEHEKDDRYGCSTVMVAVNQTYSSSAVFCDQCESLGGKCEINSSSDQYPQTTCQYRPGPDRGRISALKTRVLILIAIPAIGIGALLAFIIIVVFKRINRKVTKNDREIEAFIRNYGTLAPKRYCFLDVKRMTNSYKEKLGHGGYGDVYKGNLPDGRLVAVKVLNVSKGNGEEFINEVASIGRTSHVNVVTLLGFCLEGEKRALIYEFMPNGSLEKFIFKESTSEDNQNLGWEKLYGIAIGIARGLEYLHHGCNTRILHLDIKPQNILLDEEFCPKISDFGLSKLCSRKDSVVSTLAPRGTPGYIAPEVFFRNFGAVSLKSDIYSYGMMILEMVGGKKSVQTRVSASSEYFPDWIYRHLELVDELGLQGLKSKVETNTERKMILVGLWCIQIKPSNRPSIEKVIEMLEGSVEALPIPPKPILSSPPRPLPDSSAASGCNTISLLD